MAGASINPESFQSYLTRTNRRIAALEGGTASEESGKMRRAGAKQFEFVRLCEPLYPGESARGNHVVWNHDVNDFVETGTGCVIVFDDLCRTFALPGMVIDTQRRYGKFTTWQEFGISNVRATAVDVEGVIKLHVDYTEHCYWDQPIYLEATGTVSDGDKLWLSLDRDLCEWNIVSSEDGDPTPDTETTTTTPGANDCEGTCRWVWDDVAKIWNRTSDNCAPTTTSTTTSTTTTTPNPCAEGVCEWTCVDDVWTNTADECLEGCECLEPQESCTGSEVATPSCTPIVPPCPCLSKCTTTTPNPCPGECNWLCVDDVWQIADNDCPDCECLEPEEPCTGDDAASPGCTPTSTTTSTTTTPAPCQCQPPAQCGLEDGDCTDTFCVFGEPGGQPPCDCDCTSTTTTAAPDDPDQGCGGDCDWRIYPLIGPRLVEKRCVGTNPYCDCAPPFVPPEESWGYCGDLVQTQCDAPAPLPCDGSCKWMWNPVDLYWMLHVYECAIVNYPPPCTCQAPSEPPDDITDCVLATTQCFGGVDRCATFCSSTTPGPCTSICRWEWSVPNDRWELPDNPCDPSCPCTEPTNDGDEACDVSFTFCGPDVPTTTTTLPPPTTTTSTTSTTTTPGEPCFTICNWICTGDGWVVDPEMDCTSVDCYCISPLDDDPPVLCTDPGPEVTRPCDQRSNTTTTTPGPTTTSTTTTEFF